MFQAVSGLYRLRLGPVAFGLRDVIEKILDQLDRLPAQQAALTDNQDDPEQGVDLAEQVLDRHSEFELLARYGLDQRTDYPPDTRHLFRERPLLEGLADFLELLQALLDRLLLDDVDQRQLVNRAQFPGDHLRGLVLLFVDILDPGAFLMHRQIGQKKQLLGEQVLVSDRADIVQQGQDRDRDIAVPRLDMLEVIRQLQHRAQQNFQRLLALFLAAFADEIG